MTSPRTLPATIQSVGGPVLSVAPINPFYAARMNQAPLPRYDAAEKVVIGNATLYRADCFDVLPRLRRVDAVVTDPPFGIGFRYSSHDDSPDHYDRLMRRLVPALTRVADGGPCFAWQSPLKVDQWHRWFPKGFRVVAGCKQYPDRETLENRYAWDPIIFWSRQRWLRDELPRDWHVSKLFEEDDCPAGNPHPCPRPLDQVAYICESISGQTICDPFMGSGTTGVASLQAGKRFIGIEKDPNYFAFACRRIENAFRRLQPTQSEASWR